MQSKHHVCLVPCALSLTNFHTLLSCMTTSLNQDPDSSLAVCFPHLVHCNPIPRPTAGVWRSYHIITDHVWTSGLSTDRKHSEALQSNCLYS